MQYGTGDGSDTENNFEMNTTSFCSGTSSHVINISVADGYTLKGYVIKGTSKSTSTDITITPAEGGTATTFTNAESRTLTVSGLNTTSTSFTLSAASNEYVSVEEFYFTVEGEEPEVVDWTPSIPAGYLIGVGNKVSSVTAATSGSDNDHWYMVTQVRGGESVAYAGNNGERLRRGTTSQTAASFNGKAANANGAYFLRFISTGEPDLYKIQFGDGRYVASNLRPSATSVDGAATYAFYNSNGGNGSYFGWNLSNKSGSRVDNNAAGNDLAFWDTGEVSGSSGNNIWYVYEVTLTDPNAFVNVTYNVVDGENVIATSVVQQEKNSTVTIPAELLANTTIYDYTATGTIGESDCTITVVRTLKEGVVTDAAQISNNKLYTFTPYDASRGLLSASSSEAALNTKGANTKFALFTYEEKTYLYNFDAGKFVNDQNNISGINGYYFTLVDTPDAFVAVTPANYEHTFTLKMNDAHCINASNGWVYGAVGNWNTLDPGNQFHIIAVEDMTPEQNAALQALMDNYFHPTSFATYVISDANGVIYTSEQFPATIDETITELPATLQRDYCTYTVTPTTIVSGNNTIPVTVAYTLPFTLSTSFTDATWYYATIRGSKYLRADDSKKDASSRYQTSGTNEETDAYMWAFFGNPYSYFYIANKAQGEGKYLYAGNAPEFQSLTDPTTLDAALWVPSANGTGFSLRSVTGANLYINDAGNTGCLGYWNSVNGATDDGSRWVVTKVPTEKEKFDALIAQLEAIPFGTTVNTFTLTGDYAEYASNPSVLVNALKTAGFSTETLAAVQDVLANVVINVPAAGFYRIKGQTSGKYLASGMASNKKFAMTDATDESTVFYFSGSTLVNYSTTKANGMSASAWAWVNGETASNVAFHDGLTNGGYAIQSATAYFYDNGDGTNSADRGGNLVISAGTNARYTSWYLEPVSELKVSLTNLDAYGVEGCYTTLYMPVAVKISDEATAYAIVKNADGATLDMVACPDNVVPANTGVILNGNYAQCTATLSTEAGTATSVLTGTTPMISAVDGCYVLSVANEKLGFYKFAGTELKGFRAFYVDETADPTRGFVLNMGDPTGISSSLLTGDSSQVYDLQGRRVVNAQKGLYIINGKKVVK